MKNTIDDKVLKENNITTKKKTTVAPIAILTFATIIFAGGLYIDDASDAKMPVLLLAFVTAVYGVARILNMPTVLVHEPHNEILNEEALFFDSKEQGTVIGMLRNGEFNRLRAQAKEGNTQPVKAELYTTPSGNIAIYRVYHFVPYSFEPVTEYEVYRK